jgi:hypothetical protein
LVGDFGLVSCKAQKSGRTKSGELDIPHGLFGTNEKSLFRVILILVFFLFLKSSMTTTSRILMTILLLLAFTAGCAKNPNAPSGVSGKVTYKGEVVPAGTVTFHSPNGGIFSYSIAADGKYSGSQLPAEEMIVTVETESLNPNVAKPTYGGGRGQQAAPDQQRAKMEELGRLPKSAAPANAGPYVKIPAKYATKDKSPLKVKLTSGSNVNDFDLTD